MASEQTTYEQGATFFQNRACPYFPCHEGVDEGAFNCLFCYCPLYALGNRCGGAFRYTDKGTKDCTRCTKLHVGDSGAETVKKLFPLLVELARKDEGGNGAAGGGTSEEAAQPADGASTGSSAAPRGGQGA